MAQAELVVRSQMVPLEGMQLVMPTTCIAEIVSYQAPEPVADAPEWLLGMMDWRGLRIPLISFEAANGAAAAEASKRSRIAVLNGLNGDPELPFYGLLVQGIPRLMVLDETAISAIAEAGELPPLAIEQAQVQEQDVLIPDQDKLEAMLKAQGLSVAGSA